MYTHIGGYGFESRCAHAIFLLAFGALGRKSQRAQKGELYAAALAEFACLGVGRGSHISPDFFDACFAVYNARRLLREFGCGVTSRHARRCCRNRGGLLRKQKACGKCDASQTTDNRPLGDAELAPLSLLYCCCQCWKQTREVSE